MKAIVIGAGRGARIMPYSEKVPKCFTEVNGKRIIDWILDALYSAGVNDIHFIGGYHIDVVKAEYPEFTFHENTDWQNNNILESLFHAEGEMHGGFISSYSDIIYTRDIVRKLVANPNNIALGVDTDWYNRYLPRTLHPMNDGEKALLNGTKVLRISRDIPNDVAPAEFIGVAKFTNSGAKQLIASYHSAKKEFGGKSFRGCSAFKKAYLIHLFQEMIENGVEFSYEATHGKYFEIDTVQDLQLASTALSLYSPATL
ncbi:MAG: NTP transferase domain-containing protein [Candidatus Micrarchaeota archaeon]|nr:NTP transferase domain-containing protein [Candidatus Micrarchaeota archaeon]